MVRFVIDIEAVVGDSEAVNILLKTEREQAAEAEVAAAQRLLPALRKLLETRFPDSDTVAKVPSLH